MQARIPVKISKVCISFSHFISLLEVVKKKKVRIDKKAVNLYIKKKIIKSRKLSIHGRFLSLSTESQPIGLKSKHEFPPPSLPPTQSQVIFSPIKMCMVFVTFLQILQNCHCLRKQVKNTRRPINCILIIFYGRI